MINKQILNYIITRELGSGGMATVYEAVHVKLDTKVAIKVLNPVLAANDGIRKRFEQEAKIMASLNHEGITKVIDFDEEEKSLAIVMEYLNGQTLDEYIDKNGALKEQKAIEIFKPILEAFAYAHSKGIVHRDVKPSNIFITPDGKVKIMDFGIAKILEDGANVLTQTGTQMGTPVYMSPEQVRDSKNIDQRTDVYSLGVLLWYLLKGQPPYNGFELSAFDINTKIVTEPLPELKSYPNIDKIIKKATSKKVDSRLEGCKLFLNALQNEESTQSQLKKQEQTLIIETPKQINKQINKDKAVTITIKEAKTPIFKAKNYLIIKLVVVAMLYLIIRKVLLPLDWLLTYPDDPDELISYPIIYFTSILLGLGYWLILRKYVNTFFLVIAILYAAIPYQYLPDFFNQLYLFSITKFFLLYFSLKRRKGLFKKWFLYVVLTNICFVIAWSELVYPSLVFPFNSVIIDLVYRIISVSILPLTLGFFFIKESDNN